MPLEYTSIKQEMKVWETKVGIFDVSQGEVMITESCDTIYGKTLFNDVVNCPNFKVTYDWLNESGGVIDDMMVYKFNDESTS